MDARVYPWRTNPGGRDRPSGYRCGRSGVRLTGRRRRPATLQAPQSHSRRNAPDFDDNRARTTAARRHIRPRPQLAQRAAESRDQLHQGGRRAGRRWGAGAVGRGAAGLSGAGAAGCSALARPGCGAGAAGPAGGGAMLSVATCERSASAHDLWAALELGLREREGLSTRTQLPRCCDGVARHEYSRCFDALSISSPARCRKSALSRRWRRRKGAGRCWSHSRPGLGRDLNGAVARFSRKVDAA